MLPIYVLMAFLSAASRAFLRMLSRHHLRWKDGATAGWQSLITATDLLKWETVENLDPATVIKVLFAINGAATSIIIILLFHLHSKMWAEEALKSCQCRRLAELGIKTSDLDQIFYVYHRYAKALGLVKWQYHRMNGYSHLLEHAQADNGSNLVSWGGSTARTIFHAFKVTPRPPAAVTVAAVPAAEDKPGEKAGTEEQQTGTDEKQTGTDEQQNGTKEQQNGIDSQPPQPPPFGTLHAGKQHAGTELYRAFTVPCDQPTSFHCLAALPVLEGRYETSLLLRSWINNCISGRGFLAAIVDPLHPEAMPKVAFQENMKKSNDEPNNWVARMITLPETEESRQRPINIYELPLSKMPNRGTVVTASLVSHFNEHTNHPFLFVVHTPAFNDGHPVVFVKAPDCRQCFRLEPGLWGGWPEGVEKSTRWTKMRKPVGPSNEMDKDIADADQLLCQMGGK